LTRNHGFRHGSEVLLVAVTRKRNVLLGKSPSRTDLVTSCCLHTDGHIYE